MAAFQIYKICFSCAVERGGREGKYDGRFIWILEFIWRALSQKDRNKLFAIRCMISAFSFKFVLMCVVKKTQIRRTQNSVCLKKHGNKYVITI
jgi:hypothetical protein